MSVVYAAKNRDQAARRAGTSGGIFSPLCSWVVGRGGTVYGARFDSHMRVVHSRAETIDECAAFSGSKYVQSDMRDCLLLAAADLKAGRPVLFSGTPCQVAGLRAYLSAVAVHGDLLAVEVICHGVPSPRLWGDHLALIEARHKSRIRDYAFRDKTNGWRHPRQIAHTDEGPISGPAVRAFSEVFDYNYALRPSCHECPFARPQRGADLTIGDYWGVWRHHPELDDGGGVSLVLANTDIGAAALAAIDPSVELVELKPEEYDAPNLRRPTPASASRSAFWRAYRTSGYKGAIRRFTSYGLVRRSARGLRKALRRIASDS